MRVYLPLTLTGLARAHAAREVGPAPLAGYAVTPALAEWYGADDRDELEYAAMAAAARGSLALLADDPQAPSRRVVLAVEASEPDVRSAPGPDGEPARVEITVPVPWGRVASGHVDDPDAAGPVAAAAAMWTEAESGFEDALIALDAAEERELMWYATQELSDLLP